MRKVDREALRRAMGMVEADPVRQAVAQMKLRDETWEEVALSAAYSCQCDSLHLKPWQPPPMWVDEDRPRDDHPSAGKVAAWELRRRLIAPVCRSMSRIPSVGLRPPLPGSAARRRSRAAGGSLTPRVLDLHVAPALCVPVEFAMLNP
jgi:hypothetical protein